MHAAAPAAPLPGPSPHPIPRRNGKPTSLGCFDLEDEAAHAYDKMMLWCELHSNTGLGKGGITNFDPHVYEKDLAWLQSITQVGMGVARRAGGASAATHPAPAARCAAAWKS